MKVQRVIGPYCVYSRRLCLIWGHLFFNYMGVVWTTLKLFSLLRRVGGNLTCLLRVGEFPLLCWITFLIAIRQGGAFPVHFFIGILVIYIIWDMAKE